MTEFEAKFRFPYVFQGVAHVLEATKTFVARDMDEALVMALQIGKNVRGLVCQVNVKGGRV